MKHLLKICIILRNVFAVFGLMLIAVLIPLGFLMTNQEIKSIAVNAVVMIAIGVLSECLRLILLKYSK